MTERLSSESELIEQVKKRARSRTQVSITTVYEGDLLIRTTRKEKTIPPDPEAVAWLKRNGYEIEAK